MRLRNFGCMAPVAGAILALSSIYSLSGCGSGDGGTAFSGLVSRLINAVAGGSLTNSNATVTIPPNALAANTTISIQQGGTTPAPPAGMQVISGTTFRFGPSGTTFSTPATISIGYSEANLAGAAEASLVVARVNGGSFTTLASTVDAGANRVAAQVSTFSTYCLLGSQQSQALNPADFAGNWTGEWVNTTFGSRNNVTMSVSVNVPAKTSSTTLRVFGNVLGSFTDPAAETYSGTWNDTQFTINANSTVFGTCVLTIDRFGNLTGNANTSSNPTISSVTLTGTVTPTRMNCAYRVNFRDSSHADGTLILNKSG